MVRRAILAGLALFTLTGGVDPAEQSAAERFGANGLRVAITPSFSHYRYTIDLAPQPRDCLTPFGGVADDVDKASPRFCRDVLVTYAIARHRGEPAPDRSGRWTFHIPVVDYRALVEGIDSRLARWDEDRAIAGAPGPGGAAKITIMSDGTLIAITRVRDGKVRSIQNNLGESAGPGNPASFAKSEVQRLLLIYGPSGKVPRDADWTINARPSVSDDRCAANSFATPDSDGYGVGHDSCARALKRDGAPAEARKAG